ncbi:ATP-binding cassette subfamily C protein CydC [Rhodovulum imhoffii]|uniref:ATP-binding cassette subfamily C protein CydC n=1 Tax=Rhodovulum imhoffii TaxID=365340 RepID=A0A2T5BW32_9RHOB|nr:ATP-binding cassette domain-containing protein [Rhodovulum imhoffii]MBK5933550.1 hypothetical protein [Rhodovulum imhoffii]PTN03818.1 ATP-binding cassette subfamily C protein CydC [Rhodovulum imhoffii]
MKNVLYILRLIWRAQPKALMRGTTLAVLVLAAGVGLLGLSGWFITAAGAAGLAGVGIAFNVFQPSAGVRLLALGRTAARYGERLLTHDATLKSLTDIRVNLLRGVLGLPFTRLGKLRGAETLNRLIADVDALDGIALRLFIPAVSAVLIYAGAFALLSWLSAPVLAAWVVLSFTLGVAAALWWTSRRALAPSRRAEKALQAFRIRLIDMLRARDDLLVYGHLTDQGASVAEAEARLRANLDDTDHVERRAGVALSATATISAGGALWLGGSLAHQGAIAPAAAALGFFAAMGMSETVVPVRRGLAELGRILDAARNVRRLLPEDKAPHPKRPARRDEAVALRMENICFRHAGALRPVLEGFALSVEPGETVALTGPSGSGKSTVLALAARLIRPESGRVVLSGTDLATLPAAQLRAALTYLPQRSTLLGNSFFDVLTLADPALTEERASDVLEAMALASVVAARGGLHAPLRENGAGLSGGEQRRLVLARAVLRRPGLLLLDEPTEGLDRATADTVLAGLRRILPEATILTASHRRAERDWAERIIQMH